MVYGVAKHNKKEMKLGSYFSLYALMGSIEKPSTAAAPFRLLCSIPRLFTIPMTCDETHQKFIYRESSSADPYLPSGESLLLLSYYYLFHTNTPRNWANITSSQSHTTHEEKLTNTTKLYLLCFPGICNQTLTWLDSLSNSVASSRTYDKTNGQILWQN